MAGFRSVTGGRRPIYTADSIKIGYMQGEWYLALDGSKIARILRYHIELPTVTQSCSAVHVITPDPTYEG